MENGETILLEAKQIQVGNCILIRPGEKVSLDCMVLQGQSELDTSAITGESRPVSAEQGQTILSGSVNLTGLIKAKVIKDWQNSTATQVVSLVKEAICNKGKTEKFITKFSKIYTPIVIILAVLISIIPPIL